MHKPPKPYELAKRLRVSRNTVIEWEKEDGRSQPSWEQWEKMCSWTGISPQWFVTDDSFNSEVVDFAVRVQSLPDAVRLAKIHARQHDHLAAVETVRRAGGR